MDSCRPIKRVRVDDNDWPYLFDITDLAKLVFQYVPKMQCRQFARDSKGTLQYNICSWVPRQDIDIEIQRAILKADNVLCLSFISLNWFTLLECPLPNMLAHMLLNQDVDSVWPNACIPLCNLKIIAPRWTQFVLRKQIRALIENDKPGFEQLQFLLGLLKTQLEVGGLLRVFDFQLWNVLRPWIGGGLLTIKHASTDYLSKIPCEEFCFVPKSTYEHRTNEILNLSIQICNWNLAALLWNHTAQKSLHHKLAHCVDIIMGCENVSFVSDIWMFDRQLHDHTTSCPLQFFDSALQSFQSFEKNPVRQCLQTFLLNSSSNILPVVFKHAYIEQCENILDVMYCLFPGSDMLQTTSSMYRLCKDSTRLESAWSMIENDIRSDPLRWMRSAFNNNNTVLWQFLFDKHIITEQTLAETNETIQGKNHYYCYVAQNMIQSLGFKPVAMLTTIWNLPEVQDTNNLAGVMDAAQASRNISVLRFLNDNHAQLTLPTLLRHWNFICSNECHNLVSQVGNTHPPTFLLSTYANASLTIRETLWAIAPIKDPILFLDTSMPTFDMCVFLLQKNAINAQTLVDTLKQTKRHTALLDDIRAYTYCEADE